MKEFFSGGNMGEMFAALSFAGALVAAISFFLAERKPEIEKRPWERMGIAGFGLHVFGVIGVVSTMFYLIYTHQFQYHYVWSHSSNELPVHFMISCFWEGQEGSFLLWSFWHCMLGLILIRTAGEWRNIVVSVISFVELILSSMILGVFVPEGGVIVIYLLAILAPTGFLIWKFIQKRKQGFDPGIFPLLVGAVALGSLGMIFNGLDGSANGWWFFRSFTGKEVWIFLLFDLVMLIANLALLSALLNPRSYQSDSKNLEESGLSGTWNKFISFFAGNKHRMYSGYEILAGGLVIALAWATGVYGPDIWKLGSSPFIMMRDAMAGIPIFAMNPDFVPTNGTGLNPLLQNYWMVIHPPVLFLGFAATVVPFAFVVGGLIRGKYSEWIRPATPWTIFSVMILGVGIIMGGYWAYETLSFGGYWNWDPVENASFVPWLIGIGSLHSVLAYRKSKSFLRLSMVMVIATFLLVLYSTFLTRSGILGESSVHTFTDLGLSGQLLVLLYFFFYPVLVLLVVRWKSIPTGDKEISFLSGEFFLFLGTLIFIFSGLGITVATSLPVINKLAGTSLAPPPEIQFFYYRWNVWFAILMSLLSGMGQFLYWRIAESKDLWGAIFRPFVLAIVASSATIILVAAAGWEFAYDATYYEWLENSELALSALKKVSAYFKFGLYVFADEILLASALFTIFANIDISFRLLRKNRKSLKTIGGSLAHIGFGFMLVGMLFSSGFDYTVSENINPRELDFFNREEDKRDNVLLLPRQPRIVRGYQVTYLGKKEAVPPVQKISVIEEVDQSFKIRFKDKTGDTYAMTMPKQGFVKVSDEGKAEIDLAEVNEFLDENIRFMKPDHINDRTLYGLHFIKVSIDDSSIKYDSSRQFLLFPEAEVNPGMGLIAHPSRKIFADKDLYVHISSIPKTDDFTPKFKFHRFEMKMGDTASSDTASIKLVKIEPMDPTEKYEIRVKAHLEVTEKDSQKTYTATPIFRILKKNGSINSAPSYVEELGTMVYFTNIDPQKGQMTFEIQEQKTFEEDYVVLKAIHKPWINLLWLGTFILVAGFMVAIYRRMGE